MYTEIQEMKISERPDRVLVHIPGLNPNLARAIANDAVREARRKMPKSTGYAANRLQPIYGKEFAGLRWADSYVWFQDHGIKAFTMNSLEGKVVPMWVPDQSGELRRKNPRIKMKVDIHGQVKVLIFRKAGKKGQRISKPIKDRKTGITRYVDKPASYPGAPGRIALRQAGSPFTTPGKVGGQIARGNVGVKWRHPGLAPRLFLNNSLSLACQWNGVLPTRIYIADGTWRARMQGLLREAA